MRILDFADGFESSSEPTSVAFPATQVSVTPSGNLASTTAQAALVEHQGDIDTLNAKIGAANGIASLDSGGKVPSSQIPELALVDVSVVADIAARDALTGQEEGDVAVVTDAGSGVSKTYIRSGSSTWIELLADGSLASHQASSSAHAASAITNSPTGNLVATNVQSALNELQTDIDGRQVSGNYITSLTGDVTASGPGAAAATIANDSVSNAKAANMATQTIKGRTTTGTGDPEDLTATQATAILNPFVGDSGSGGIKGLVPAPASGDSTKFLKGDGTWASASASSAGQAKVLLIWTGSKSLSHDGDTKLDLSSASFTLLTGVTHSSGTFTPTTAGYYYITFAAKIDNVVDGSVMRQHIAKMYRNGSVYKRSGYLAGLAGNNINAGGTGGALPEPEVSGLVYFNGTTDYVEFYLYQANGSGNSKTCSEARIDFIYSGT